MRTIHALSSGGGDAIHWQYAMFVQRVQSVWFVLSVDEARGLIRLRRTAHRITTEAELVTSFEQLTAELGQIVAVADRGRYGLLQDMRDAPLLDKPELEAVQLRCLEPIRHGWRRGAVLVRTPIGKLQARRMTNKSQSGSATAASTAIFDDELEALNFLCATS